MIKDDMNSKKSFFIPYSKQLINENDIEAVVNVLKSELITQGPLINSFEEKEVGAYFVYNLGDKIDFNHPNRLGHKLIAQQINDRNICIK